MGDKSYIEADPTDSSVKEQMLREARALDKGISSLKHSGASYIDSGSGLQRIEPCMDCKWTNSHASWCSYFDPPGYSKQGNLFTSNTYKSSSGCKHGISWQKPCDKCYASTSSTTSSISYKKTLGAQDYKAVIELLGEGTGKQIVFSAVHNNPKKTAAELISIIRKEFKEKDPNVAHPRFTSLHKRFSELARQELIKKVGQRVCTVTGEVAAMWEETATTGTKKAAPRVEQVYKLMAVGGSPSSCIETFVEAIGWKLLSTEELPSTKRLAWRFLVHTDDGQTFEAGGKRVVGGVALTHWR